MLLGKIMMPSRDGKGGGFQVVMTSSPSEMWFGEKRRGGIGGVTGQLTTCAGEHKRTSPCASQN